VAVTFLSLHLSVRQHPQPTAVNPHKQQQYSAGEQGLHDRRMPGLTSTSAEAGEEVLATYGAHSNDKLLVHYGFICASTMQHASPDDEVRLDHVIIPHLSEETKSQLQDVGFLGGYALLPTEYPCDRKLKVEDIRKEIPCKDHCRQPWELCFKTQVAVRAVLLTANEWEYFVTNGEDLSGDQSAAVNKWLQPHLQGMAAEALKKHVELQKLLDGDEPLSEDRAVGVRMLYDRWKQIDTHLGMFPTCI
jgi:hypothetical protein